MVSPLYAYTAFVCALAILILLSRTKLQLDDVKVNASFTFFLNVTMWFCIIDGFWGIFAARPVGVGTWVLTLFSYLFFLMAAFASYNFVRFSLFYFFTRKSRIGDLIKYCFFALMIIQWTLILSNFVNSQVFYVTDDFIYHTGIMRTLIFYIQFFNYIAMLGVSVVFYFVKNDDDRARGKSKIAVIFSVFPIMMGVVQLLFPDAPAYSVAFMLTAVTIYAYTITEERENLLLSTKQLELEKENGQKQLVDYGVIKRLADDVDYVGVITNSGAIKNYRVAGIFSEYLDPQAAEIDFFTFDNVMRELMNDSDYLVFSKRATRDIVLNRLKTEDSFNLMVNFQVNDEDLQYRVSFFKHPDEFYGVIMSIRNFTEQLKEIKEKEEALVRASIDGLTGLLNKTAFEDKATAYINKKTSKGVGFFFLDLDHFKEVNDNLGHAEGDKVLQDTAEKLKKIFRKDDLVSRQGGDEFCIFVPNISKEKLEERAVTLHEKLKDVRKGPENEVEITASIGCVFCKDSTLDYASLRAKADEAMYAVKKNGRNDYLLREF